MTRTLPLPKPTCFVDKSKAGNMMVSFLMPSELCLLLEVESVVTEMHSFSAMMLVSVRLTFIRAFVTR